MESVKLVSFHFSLLLILTHFFSVVKARRDPLEEEKSQLNQGIHPAYLDEVKQAKARYEQELKENGELEEVFPLDCAINNES
jgi:hypothetical protein